MIHKVAGLTVSWIFGYAIVTVLTPLQPEDG